METNRSNRIVPAYDPKVEQKKIEISILKSAYRLADEEQMNVYVVMTPETNREYTPNMPYCVLDKDSTEYERKNGILITPRII